MKIIILTNKSAKKNVFMEKKEIIFLAVAFAIAGVRLYQKYVKKNNPGTERKPVKGSELISSSKDDDYEPYSGK